MKQKSLVLTVLLLFVIVIFSNADEIITIEKALELSEQSSSRIRIAENNLNQAKMEKESSWNLLLPSFLLSSTTNSYDDPVKFFSDNMWNETLTGAMTLTVNGALADTIDSYELNTVNFWLNRETAVKGISTQVQSLFYYLLASEENISIQEQTLELAEKQYKQMQMNFANGYASEMDVLQSQLAMENIKPNISRAVLSHEQNLMIFRDLLGMDNDDSIDLKGELIISILELNADELIDDYISGRLDIQTYLNILDIQKNLLDMNKRVSSLPMLSLTTAYSNSYIDITDSSASPMVSRGWGDNLSLSLTLSWNPEFLFKGSSTWVGIKKQEKEVENARLSLKESMKTAAREIKSAVLELTTLANDLEVAELNVQLAYRTYEMTDESFKKGTAEILVLENARQDLESARQNQLNSLYQYRIGLISLSSALDTDVKTLIKEYGNE